MAPSRPPPLFGGSLQHSSNRSMSRDPSSGGSADRHTGESNNTTSSALPDPQHHVVHQQRAFALSHQMALSSAETILLSSAGDVVVCRCRSSNYPQHLQTSNEEEPILARAVAACQKDVAVVCCEMDEISEATQEHAICGSWTGHAPSEPATVSLPNRNMLHPRKGGLLGGSPASVAPPLHPSTYAAASEQRDPGLTNRAQKAFQSDPIAHFAGLDDGSIVPIKSFDCSHFMEADDEPPYRHFPEEFGQEEKKSDNEVSEANKQSPQPPLLVHGIPTFLSKLSQVKVTQVSAHPLGSHVLLIAEAGLLYGYGLNNYGQLGLGRTTSTSGPHNGFIMTPTIVTPLLENGGKAIACAAGVSHSLVAVMTEERRLIRSQTQPYGQNPHSPGAAESLAHHQLYGFGRNDFMKIGLISPKVAKHPGRDEMEVVTVPRRVALRCRVPQSWQQTGNGLTSPPPGIFAISASEEHSAALVHRSSGDVELYTWGNSMHGALGLPQQPPLPGNDGAHRINESPAVQVVPVPSFVASLSRSSNAHASSSSLLMRHYGEYPSSVSLAKHCSFVTTSMGRAFSFGSSSRGMLGLGDGITQVQRPQELSLPSAGDTFVSVSAGAEHAVALGASGSVYSWGVLPQNYKDVSNGLVRIDEQSSSNQMPPEATWVPQEVDGPKQNQSQRDGKWKRVVAASAGFDSSTLLVDSGHVFSSGRPSGRLGLGETRTNVVDPKPVFGGLRLWYHQNDPTLNPTKSRRDDRSSGNPKTPPAGPPRVKLVRGSTFG